MTAARIETRSFRAGDEGLVLDGHERARRAAGGGPEREPAELRWRYGEAPHGACLAVALDEEGRAIAGVSATRQRVRFQGSDVFWLEVGDLFSDFGSGAGLARAGTLRAVGGAFAEAFGGFPPAQHPVLYGLPNRRAHRVGLRHLEWEVLRSENELALALEPLALRPSSAVEVREPPRFPEDVARIFEACAAERQAILVRDAAYLNWRYVERPGAPFTLGLAERAGEAVGLAVVRGGELFDWLARPEDEDCVQSLAAWAAARALAAGHTRLTAVFPDSAPEWTLFQRLGFRVGGTSEYLCFRSFQRPAIMSWLYRHWSYTRGDTLR